MPSSVTTLPRLCVDIDNCIARTDEVMRRIIREFTEGRVDLLYEDVVEFDYHRCTDHAGCSITKDEWKAIHDQFSEAENLLAIEPIEGAISALETLIGPDKTPEIRRKSLRS